MGNNSIECATISDLDNDQPGGNQPVARNRILVFGLVCLTLAGVKQQFFPGQSTQAEQPTEISKHDPYALPDDLTHEFVQASLDADREKQNSEMTVIEIASDKTVYDLSDTK